IEDPLVVEGWVVLAMSKLLGRGMCALRVGSRHFGLVAIDLPDRDEWEAQVSNPLEETVESCLVDDLAADDGRTVVQVADGQSVEPRGPVRVEMPRESDLITSGLGAIRSRRRSFCHSAPCAP